jgi:hypothetical protein
LSLISLPATRARPFSMSSAASFFGVCVVRTNLVYEVPQPPHPGRPVRCSSASTSSVSSHSSECNQRAAPAITRDRKSMR